MKRLVMEASHSRDEVRRSLARRDPLLEEPSAVKTIQAPRTELKREERDGLAGQQDKEPGNERKNSSYLMAAMMLVALVSNANLIIGCAKSATETISTTVVKIPEAVEGGQQELAAPKQAEASKMNVTVAPLSAQSHASEGQSNVTAAPAASFQSGYNYSVAPGSFSNHTLP